MTKPMTADDIATALRGNPPIDRLHELQRACHVRRTEIRARLAAIEQSSNSSAAPHGPIRLAAIERGVEAVQALDHEADHLQIEFTLCDDLELRAVQQLEAAKLANARAGAPAARRKLPAAIRTVHSALAELDKAMGAVAALVEPLAVVAGIRGERFPLADDELAALLEAREAIWAPRHLAALLIDPDARHEYPRSHALLFEVRGGGRAGGARIISRPPPRRVYLPDLTNE